MSRVREPKPIIDRRFEQPVDGRTANEAGDRWNAVIDAEPEDSTGIDIRDGVARFTPTPLHRHRMAADEAIPDFNRDSFTVEFWASIDYFHWATFVALMPDEDVESELHLNLIEFPYRSALIDSPGSFRFLHRSPPGDTGGFNLFSSGGCTPGLWHHIAVTKTLHELRLYLDGHPVRRLSESLEPDEKACGLNLGSLYTNRPGREFAGAIDEPAVCFRALSDIEILFHDRAMRLVVASPGSPAAERHYFTNTGPA